MEAGSYLRRLGIVTLVGCFACIALPAADAANKRTRNFIIQAPTPQLAEAVGQAAEKYRHDLAVYWTGQALPPWPTPCPVRVIAGPNLAAQGVTTYNPRPVSDFQMEVVGTPERILDSVLPHEVTHTVLATYFGRPLPRWADEGICTTVEHVSERSKHEAKLREFLRSRRGIAMNQLFLMTEYPSDVLPMYAQGYSVCRFLIEQKGPQTFIAFLRDYMRQPSWTTNIKKHYEYDSLAELQEYWLAWVSSGSGSVDKFAKASTSVQPASATIAAAPATAANPVSLAAPSQTTLQPSGQPQPVTQPAPARPVQGGIAPATMLASTNASGWYQRKKLEAQSDPSPQPGTTRTATNGPLAPPSVRNSGPYQSAHPQPEQRISRGGLPVVQPGGGSSWLR